MIKFIQSILKIPNLITSYNLESYFKVSGYTIGDEKDTITIVENSNNGEILDSNYGNNRGFSNLNIVLYILQFFLVIFYLGRLFQYKYLFLPPDKTNHLIISFIITLVILLFLEYRTLKIKLFSLIGEEFRKNNKTIILKNKYEQKKTSTFLEKFFIVLGVMTLLGLGKEIYDTFTPGRNFEILDLIFNIIGLSFAYSGLYLIKIFFLRKFLNKVVVVNLLKKDGFFQKDISDWVTITTKTKKIFNK